MATDRREEEEKPLPEDLLFVARCADEKPHEGQLAVYLGYAPGVGKTYSMLQY
jgi:K+-sensing histidine kinase KdpD